MNEFWIWIGLVGLLIARAVLLVLVLRYVLPWIVYVNLKAAAIGWCRGKQLFNEKESSNG